MNFARTSNYRQQIMTALVAAARALLPPTVADKSERPRPISEILDIRHDFIAGLRGTGRRDSYRA